MSQTRAQSFIEATANIVIGCVINFIATIYLFPVFGWEISVVQNIELTVCFTVISLIRSYLLRGFYNWKHSL